MNVGSLFSGIGGIEIGLHRAGDFEPAWFVESDLHAQAILRKRFPTATIYGDITTLDFSNLPKVDILTGGFPCQDISDAGKRIGISGSRSSLWKYYLQAISTIRPRIALIENVAALTRRGLSTVLCDLASVGYDAEWHCVPASSVGAPHRRDRIFIIAYPVAYANSGRCEAGISDTSRKDTTHRIPEKTGDAFPYSDSECSQRPPSRSEEGLEGKSQLEVGGCGTDVSDTNLKRLERQGIAWTAPDETQLDWSSEPLLGRVADGVPCWVDRIKRLGNAVVPAVAEAIGKTITEVEQCENQTDN